MLARNVGNFESNLCQSPIDGWKIVQVLACHCCVPVDQWTTKLELSNVILVSYTCITLTVYLSLGSIMITTNNTEVLITDIGEDISGGLPSLTCHTDLVECCRNSDNNNMGSLGGEWYYPDGSVVPNSAAAWRGFL